MLRPHLCQPLSVIALARALGVKEDYLLGEPDMALEGVEFRKKDELSAKEQARVDANVLHLVERYLAVEEILGLPVEWDEPRGAPYPVTQDLVEADRAAHILREQWGLGLDPIPKFVELLESHGIKVLMIADEKVDGLAARVSRKRGPALPVIVINSRDWAERKRFNLAHELGHLLMQVGPGLDAEKVAHRFASAFLMPAEAVWNEVGKHRTSISLAELVRLKELFGASCQAITYRCKDLGIFSQSLYEELFAQFKANGWRTSPYQEAGALPPEESRRLERLCYRALSEGAISESKAAELLGLSAHELNRKLDAAGEVGAAA